MENVEVNYSTSTFSPLSKSGRRRDVSRAPRRLKVETSCLTINIENFAGEV